MQTAALLVVAVAVIALLDTFSDGNDDRRSSDQPMATATTEVPAPTAVDEATATGADRSQAGPLLPELTGATLVVATHLEIGVVELDTGAVRSVALPWARQLRDRHHVGRRGHPAGPGGRVRRTGGAWGSPGVAG